jgi:ketosteroid isomerase-like protein
MQTAAQTEVKDDPKAREALRKAFENTARWQANFKGFTADLTVNVNGKETKGSVTVKGPRELTVSLPDGDVQKWAENQIGMIAVHRGPRSFEESDGKYALTLGDDVDHPMGPKLFINGDGMHSFYRVKDGRITQINRKMGHGGGPPFGFTINVEDSMVTKENKFLTTRYTVYYYSTKDGKLTNTESFTDAHVRVDASDLPATRRIIAYENGEVTVKSLTFSNHKML